jgi:hypothetical protein
VRASFWVTEKGADALIEFGADDVFELASLGVGFGIINGERILEKALCEAMTAHYIASTAAAGVSKMYVGVAHLDEFQIGHAAESASGIQSSGNLNAIESRAGALFATHPDALQQMIEANFVVNGNGGIGLRGVETEMAVSKLNAAASLASDVGVVSDHQNGVAGIVQGAKNIDDQRFVSFVEISGGLVGEN